MIVDAQQREQAVDPGQSFIVEAPAGSGKTALLVQRILRLLSGVERPESVVAMTFTRKAAAEMRERVLSALKQASEDPPPVDEFDRANYALAMTALKQDKKQSWNLLQDPGRLQIQTIDSFCALLTRQMPVLSRFGGFGEVIEEASELYLRAARDMLTMLAEGDEQDKLVFRRMVLHFDNNVGQLENQVVIMLSKRDQWEHLVSTSDNQLVEDCCRMLRLAEVRLRVVFQHAGKVDFTEIARAARRALGKPEQPSDLLYSLDYRIQHLLVDEFQDTSRSQFELIKALTEQWSLGDDHTLFLVGDPMQSIYRFREADVSLFLQCWHAEKIGGVHLTPVRLQTNFRTTANILSWVQTQFDGMMVFEDNLQTGAVRFRQSFAGRGFEGPAPRLTAYIDDSGGQEAAEVVNIIQSNAGSEVAILVRSRAQTLHILPALRKAGIQYEAIDIEALKDQQHVIDVLSLTRSLINVADRVSWLACLRAPWCGLTLEDLSALIEGKRDRIVLDVLSDVTAISSLSVDGRVRAVRVQEILSEGVAKVGRVALRKLVEQTWQALGGLAVVAEGNQRQDVEALFRLIEESEEGGIIRDFSLMNRQLEFLYARPAGVDLKVKVMTVHQAKGLEFEIVILPGIGRKGRESDQELLVWADRDGDLDIAAKPQAGELKPEYKRITEALIEKDKHEARRLFYVACTRAIDQLYLLGSATVNKDGQLTKASSKTFLGLMWENVKPEFESKLRGLRRVNAMANPSNSRCPLRRLPVDWIAPAIANSIQAEAPMRRAVASQRQVSFRWVSDTSRHAGTVVHEILKRIAAEGTEKWSEARVTSLRAFAGSELLRLGVPADDKRAATDQVIRAVTKTVASQRGRWILSAHPQSHSEWAINGRVEKSLVVGTIDRAFLDGDVFWIIDFKTGQHESRDLDHFLASEKERYRPQLEQYAAVVSSLVNAPITMGLYFPMHDAWLEWKFSQIATATS